MFLRERGICGVCCSAVYSQHEISGRANLWDSPSTNSGNELHNPSPSTVLVASRRKVNKRMADADVIAAEIATVSPSSEPAPISRRSNTSSMHSGARDRQAGFFVGSRSPTRAQQQQFVEMVGADLANHNDSCDHTSSERKVEVVPLPWPDSAVVTPTSRRKHRPDSPRPPSSTRSVSVPSVDGESSSSRGGWGCSFGGEEEARVAPGDYFCQVCLEDKHGKAGFVLSSCGHVFCRACLKGYVVTKVNDGQVYPICFRDVEDGGETDAAGASGKREDPNGGLDRRGTKSCGVGIQQKDIEVLLASDRTMRRKYSRFLFCREHATARECPRCNKLQVGNPMEAVMKCIDCGAEYCYYHGGAHEGRTCAEYIESTAEETDRTLALIRRLTKPCPGCQTPVEKLGGCNQMICYHCSTSFCWICGQEVDRGTFPVHFQWWNVRGCPNQQLQEEVSPSRASRRCHKILSVLQIVIVGPPALFLTVASSLACICCLPAFNIPPRQLFMGCFSGWGNFVMVLPILPFILAGAIVLGLIYIILLPFRLVCAVGRKYRLKKMEAASIGGVTSGSVGGIGETGRLRALESGYSATSVENGEAGGRTEGPLVGPRPRLSLSSSSSSSPSFPTSLASPLAEMIRGGDRRNRQEQHSLDLRRHQLEHQLQLHLQMDRDPRPSQTSPSFWVASRLRQNLATHSDMATISPSPQSPQALASNRPSLLPPADSERSWDMGNVDIEAGLATASSREGLGSSSGAALTMIGPNIEMPGTMGTSLGVREMVGLWLGASPFASSAGAGAFSSSRPTSMATTVDRVGGGKGEASDTCE